MSAVESLGTVEDIDLRLLLKALTGLGAGEFTTRLPDHWEGLPGKIAAAFNETAERHQQLVGELERLSRGARGRRSTRGRSASFWRRLASRRS